MSKCREILEVSNVKNTDPTKNSLTKSVVGPKKKTITPPKRKCEYCGAVVSEFEYQLNHKDGKCKKLTEAIGTIEGQTFDDISRALGYDGLQDFLGDNPGAVDVLATWIGEQESLSNTLVEFYSNRSPDELQKLERIGMFDIVNKVEARQSK